MLLFIPELLLNFLRLPFYWWQGRRLCCQWFESILTEPHSELTNLGTTADLMHGFLKKKKYNGQTFHDIFLYITCNKLTMTLSFTMPFNLSFSIYVRDMLFAFTTAFLINFLFYFRVGLPAFAQSICYRRTLLESKRVLLS